MQNSDTPSSESSLDTNSAAAAFASLIDPSPDEGLPKVDTEIDLKEKTAEPEAPAEPPEDPPEALDDGVEVEIDGKPVRLTKEQIAEAYKSGLRQADYTKKTMEASDVKKAAQAELGKAQADRAQYADNLQRMAVQLETVLQAQQQTDWNALLDNDPVEYLKQQHLFQQRQAAYQQNTQQRQVVASQMQAEQAKSQSEYIQIQQQELLAKLPAWKDATKASAERDALKSYLKTEGYDDASITGISDHKAVLLARKAMLYDQMMTKASAAAKKVATLPAKVERPGVQENSSLDKRGSQFARLGKTGRVEDAAKLFTSFL
jgi:hypothetical protein